jgi:hypothetical protein
VPPPPSPSPGPSSGGRPRQPSPPSNGSATAPAPSISQASVSNGAGSVHLSSTGSSNSGTTRSPAGPESSPQRSVLASVGGDTLAGSGFEGERPAAGFVAHSDSAPTRSAGSVFAPPASPASNPENPPPTDTAGGTDPAVGVGPSAVSDVQSVSSSPNSKHGGAGPPVGERVASTARRTQRVFSGAADRLRGTRQQFGGLPSDAAPHTQPPRMPIDHSE